MSTKTPKSLAELVQASGSPIGDLARRAQATLDLAEHLRGALEPTLASHLQGCHLRDDGTLMVLADAPAWAARLRFESETLLARCRERHAGAARLMVRVAHDGSA